MNNNRILNIFIPYFLPDKSYGGPIISIYSLSNFLSKIHKVKVLTTSLEYRTQKTILKSKLKKEKNFNFSIIRSNSHLELFLKTVLVMLTKSREIIYINSFFYISNSFPFFLISRLSSFQNNKLLISPRAELQPQKIKVKKKVLKNLIIFFYKILASKDIIFISASDTEYEINRSFFPDNKHTLLSNLPRFNKYLPFKKSSKKLKVLLISRIHPGKGLHVFLNSLQNIDEILEIEIYIKGSISDLAYFKKVKIITENLIKKGYKVELEDHVEVSMKLLNGFDIMVLPSIGENFCHAIVESSQSGMFCLISDKTPWFKNTKGAEQKLTYLSCKDEKLYFKAIKKLTSLNEKQIAEYVEEQQLEIKLTIDKSFEKQKNLFSNF